MNSRIKTFLKRVVIRTRCMSSTLPSEVRFVQWQLKVHHPNERASAKLIKS